MRKQKKVLTVLLAVLLLSGIFGTGAYAKADAVKNVVCSMYSNGATARGFSWSTNEKSGSDVQIIKTENYSGSFKKAKTYSGECSKYRDHYTHQVVVTDLKPATKYTYRVGDAKTGIWSKTGKFTTDNKDNKFAFLTLADVQASSTENFNQAYRTAKAAWNTLPNAAFYVNLGDYVNDNTDEQWDMYFKAFSGIHRILTHVPVVGNHDGIMDGNLTGTQRSDAFKNYFCLENKGAQAPDGIYYSFDYGNAHFAVLNTNDMYPMSQGQRNWLINDMSASDAEWKIILAHRSVYSAGKNIDKPDTIIMREVLIPIIDKLGIDMVYAGHDHMYLRTAPVYGDKKTDTSYVTEMFGGKKTKFAVNPKGTVYALPSTAGTKRYSVNENAIEPILSVADKAISTQELGGCFCTTEIEGNRLVYRAYSVNDKTGKIKLIDSFAIKKTEKKESIEKTALDEGAAASIISQTVNLPTALLKMIASYLKLLVQVIKNQF